MKESRKSPGSSSTRKSRGTAITYEDLALKFIVLAERARRRQDDSIPRASCWKLQLQPPGRQSQYSKVLSGCDKQSGALMRMEGYDWNAKLVQRFEVVSAQKSKDGCFLKQMRIEEHPAGDWEGADAHLSRDQKDSLGAQMACRIRPISRRDLGIFPRIRVKMPPDEPTCRALFLPQSPFSPARKSPMRWSLHRMSRPVVTNPMPNYDQLRRYDARDRSFCVLRRSRFNHGRDPDDVSRPDHDHSR